jgi:hypothetical protein
MNALRYDQTSQKQKNQDRDCRRFNSPTSPLAPLPPVQKTESAHPKIQGLNGAILSFSEHLFELAAVS